MKKQKIIYLVIVTLIVFSLVCSTVSAVDDVIAAQYIGDGTPESWLDKIYAVYGNERAGIGESFTVESAGYLSAASFYVKRLGDPHLTLQAGLASSSTGALSGSCNTTVWLATSTNSISAADISTSAQWITFNFNRTLNLPSSGVYYIVLYATVNTGSDSSNCVIVGKDSTGSVGYYRYPNAANPIVWTMGGTNDIYYIVYVNAEAASTPTPTPAGMTPTPTANPVETTTATLLPLLIPLIIILVCAVICWYMAGAWGFFAGVNLGIILVYVLTPAYMPLWGVVAMIVVDACLLFGKIGFGSR